MNQACTLLFRRKMNSETLAINIQKYWNPKDFYQPPATVPAIEASGIG